jgi:hypothetical protein
MNVVQSWWKKWRAATGEQLRNKPRHRQVKAHRVGVESLEARLVLSDVSLPAVADAYIRGSTYSSVNYGNATRLIVKNDTRDVYDCESYLRFDLTQNPGVVQSATLQLVPAYLGRDAARTNYRVRLLSDGLDGWVEGNGGKDNLPVGEIAWARRPVASGAEATFSGSQLVRGRTFSLNVTHLVNQAMNANRVLSFQIDAVSAPGMRGDVQFYSRENASMRPALLVTLGPANRAPTAVSDSATTAEDTAKTIAVLANDTDPDGDRPTVLSVAAPAHGTARLNTDGTITYTPAGDYFGADSFQYTIADQAGVTATATVSVTVTAVNDPPVASDDAADVAISTAAVLRVMSNDRDVDSATLSIATVAHPAHGSVVVNSDKTMTYTPATNYTGSDTFTYSLSDGTASSIARVNLWVGRSSISSLQQLTYDKFNTLTTAEIPFLTTTQIASIPNEWWFKQMSTEQRAALRSTQVQAVNVGAVGLSGLTAPQVGQLTTAQIQQVKYQQFRYLTSREAPSLTPAQIGTIDSEWSFKQMTAEARAVLSAAQVQGLNVAAVGINALTPAQIGQLTTAQIQQVKYQHFNYLTAREAAMLTTTQIASIDSEWSFKQMSDAARAALSATQVQAINVRPVGINALTSAQVGFLTTSQIQQVVYQHFKYLTPREVPQLTTTQIGTIDHEWWMKQIPAASRAALSAAQVQALNVSAVGIDALTPTQVGQLTTAQIQQVNFTHFKYLTARESPLLTATQIASIDSEWSFKQMTAEARAALTATQVQAINVPVVGINALTTAQIGQLTTAQVQQVKYQHFNYLTAREAPMLTTTQVASIDNEWSFKQMKPEARAALTATQVQALIVSAVGIGALTPAQIGQLTTTQVQQVKYQQFNYLSPREVPMLSTAQIASIDNEWSFKQMSDAARAALTATQIQALSVPRVGINQLTPSQINQLTTAQVQQVDMRQFGKLTAREIPLLTTGQIDAIDNEWWFTRIPLELRSLLSQPQIQALDTAIISLRTLSPAQREELSVPQVQSIHPSDFRLLTPEQAAQLTTTQMAAIEHYWDLHSMPDESQAALSREQLLSLSPEVFARSVGLPESFASTNDFPHTSLTCEQNTEAGQPHTDDAGKQHEHLALLELVAPELATHVTVASGSWSNPTIWQGGAVPGLNSRVIVSAGNTVTFDAVYVNPIKTVRVDGVLQFATQYDTQLMADTIVVDGKGTLRVGTAAQPINAGVTARILIADTGPIDQTVDPNQLGRGLISHGAVEMVGQAVTPYVALATPPKWGDTQLVLAATPTNWAVGHRIVLTGSWHEQHEELEITAINGNVVSIDHALKFNHKTPVGYELSHYVANTNRNVVVMSQNVDVNARRGHVMFMHSQNVQVHNAGFYGLGRTDKRNPVNDPVFDEDCNLVANTGLNRRGRYAVHFHRSGVNGTKTPAVIDGSVVVDSPGWGFVNHDSFVNMADNVAFDVVGAAFVTEVGNEIGSFRRNLAIHSTGSGDGLESREDIFDFGHQGHGFWFQGPGVEVEGNIAANQEDAAFIFFTESSEAQFEAANMVDPTLAAGHALVPVGSVPLRLVKDNLAFASGSGLETWFHMTNMTSGQSVIDGFTAWNTGRPMFIPYTGRTTIQDVTLVGNRSNPWGTAIGRNSVTNNITYRNVHIAGFEVGIDVPVRRATIIEGGYFETIIGIEISTTVHKNRTVDINVDPETGEDPEFAPLTTTQLHGHTQWEIFMDGTPQVKHNDIETLFAPDVVRLGTVRLNGKQIYYLKQASDFVPFPSGATIGDGLAGLIPPELLGKTNQQLWAEFGLAPAGVIAPPDAVQIPGINGLVGSPSVYPPELELISRKYINKLDNYKLVFIDGDGELIHDPTLVTLREGWNLITRTVHGMPRTFFVFGDTEAPTFQLSAETKLVINPLGLDFGFNVRGTILDNSFGSMMFHKKFDDLRERPLVTRPDGSQFILLDFTIRDLAGNTTTVTLELTIDPTAPVIQGTEQRDLPPRELSVTLYELLEYYMITGQTDITDLMLPPLVL